MDVSADLTELGRTPVAVVCAGAKSVCHWKSTFAAVVFTSQSAPAWAAVPILPAVILSRLVMPRLYSIKCPWCEFVSTLSTLSAGH